MKENLSISSLNEYFLELSARTEKACIFSKITVQSANLPEFLEKFYTEARRTGIAIEGRIPNPTEANLSYYSEIMGMNFELNLGFISSSLKKWLPRIATTQNTLISASIYDCLFEMKKAGKSDSILKNVYTKFMCWLYYKFERLISQLGNKNPPKVIIDGQLSAHEMSLLSILHGAGCDIIILNIEGYSLAKIREDMSAREKIERLYGKRSNLRACTNSWCAKKGINDLSTATTVRGSDANTFYNAYYRINGVEDKLTYLPELLKFHTELVNSKRRVLVIDKAISAPTNEEISSVVRINYTSTEQMLSHISNNISYSGNSELQALMRETFIDTLLVAAKDEAMNLNKLTNLAVYIICWLKRYSTSLFSNWKLPDIGALIYLNAPQSDKEILFLQFISRLPVDVLILCPNLNAVANFQDERIFEHSFQISLAVSAFPQAQNDVRVGTVAYHAERELDTLMYAGTGMYRTQQYAKANIVNLQTMYEEIQILWDAELKYRPCFETTHEAVTMPVIFSKISGIPDGNVSRYWSSIKALMTDSCYVIKSVPFITSYEHNPIKQQATNFWKNGKLLRNTIKSSPAYQYAFLREEIQEHMLDKLEVLINKKLIRGTFQNGTEYTIISTVLNLNRDILRLIQSFDFTKKNPKLIYIHTSEKSASLEDSILLAYLNLIGFDVLVFVPTGYQCVEAFYNTAYVEQHNIGNFVYDLSVPNFNNISSSGKSQWKDKIFKRGG